MKKSSKLFNLIIDLSPDEIELFSRETIKSEQLSQKLFDAHLDLAGHEYDEKELKIRLKDSPALMKNLSWHKNYLFDYLIRLYTDSPRSGKVSLNLQLAQATFLMGKGLYEEAKKMILKVNTESEKQGNYPMVLIAINQERALYYEYEDADPEDARARLNTQQEQQTLGVIHRLSILFPLHEAARKSKGDTEKHTEILAILDELQPEIFAPKECVLALVIRFIIHRNRREYIENIHLLRQAHEITLANSGILQDAFFLSLFFNIAHELTLNLSFIEPFISVSQTIPASLRKKSPEAFPLFLRLKDISVHLQSYINITDPVEWEQGVLRSLNAYTKIRKKTHCFARSRLDYLAGYACFVRGEYAMATKHFSNGYEEKPTDLTWPAWCKLIDMLCKVELGEFAALEAMLPAAVWLIKKAEIHTPLIQNIISYLNVLCRSQNDADRHKALIYCKEKHESVIQDPSLNFQENYFYFSAHLKAKLAGHTMETEKRKNTD